MINILIVLYLIFIISICMLCFSKKGKRIYLEFLAYRETQRYMHSKGLEWQPRERSK